MIDCLADYLCNANINDNIQDNCDNPMFSGMEAGAYIFNKGDISDVVSSEDNSNLIVDFALKDTDKRGYFIINPRNNPFTGTNTAVEVGDYRNTFTRTVSLFIPMDGADVVKNIIDPIANGRFVVILHNQYVNDKQDNEFPIFGLDRGLVVSSLTQTKYENNDYWVVELQESGVPTANKFFKHGTEVPTYTSIDSFSYNGVTYEAGMLGFRRETDGGGNPQYILRNTAADLPVTGATIVSMSEGNTLITVKFDGNENLVIRFTVDPNLDTLAEGDISSVVSMERVTYSFDNDTCEFLNGLTNTGNTVRDTDMQG
jgi:hypothetical protein